MIGPDGGGVAYAVVPAVAFGASLLTFFSGFGLGTILLPAFAAFFPAETAIGLTAVVHLLNNLFKAGLVGRHADAGVAVRFGLPAVAAAFGGAALLVWLAGLPPLYTWTLGGRTNAVSPVAFVVAILMVVFAALDLWPRFRKLEVPRRWLPAGGLLSGFFGGLSGHQGALRSAFLLRAGLGKEAFVATGIVVAVAVDLVRLGVYSERFLAADVHKEALLVGVSVAAAFAGAWLGNRLLRKTSLRAIEVTVSVLLVLVALGLGSGLL